MSYRCPRSPLHTAVATVAVAANNRVMPCIYAYRRSWPLRVLFCCVHCLPGINCTAPPRTAQVYNLERLPRNLIHRLVREVRIHADLQHKNVVQMYGVFQVRRTGTEPTSCRSLRRNAHDQQGTRRWAATAAAHAAVGAIPGTGNVHDLPNGYRPFLALRDAHRCACAGGGQPVFSAGARRPW